MKSISKKQQSYINLIKVQDLRMVIALSKQGTILRAAEVMGISQPAITKRLQDLEKDLEISLFHRMSRGVEPTPYGEIIIKHAHIVLNQIRQAEGEISDLSGNSGGRITVGVPISAASDLISSTIADLINKRKDVEVTMVEGYNIELIPALKRGDIDLIAGRLPRGNQYDDIEQESLYKEKLIAVVNNNHKLASSSKVTAKDLTKYKWVMPLKDSILYSQIDSFFKKKDLKTPRASIYSLSHINGLKLLKSTQLIGIFPVESIQNRIDSKEVTSLNIDMSSESSTIGIVTRLNGFTSPATEMFKELLRNNAKQINK